jgi:hypothetical protein
MPNSRITAGVTCAICERSLLLGEQPVRFSPDGREYVDVCPLCQQTALEFGWFREGAPSLPTIEQPRRRTFFSGLLKPKARAGETIDEPLMRRLSRPDKAVVEAAQLFNESPFRRTIEGIARSLGPPSCSIVLLSGLNAEVVITVAWDITWYQYRVGVGSAQPLRLAGRGHDPEELEPPFTDWNADLTEDCRLVPDVAKA